MDLDKTKLEIIYALLGNGDLDGLWGVRFRLATYVKDATSVENIKHFIDCANTEYEDLPFLPSSEWAQLTNIADRCED